MAVRINLKEVFASDPEELTLDKINFNFNELIRLGLGKKGDRGITGPEGSIGPFGIQGDPGDRGNTWFSGVGNPNGQSFTGLIDGDFFLDTDATAVWEYDAGSDSWSQITDISAVVNNFLASAGQTFKRGFGEGSPQDQRFITFLNRDDSINDSSLSNGSDNDIFFLHNFEELDLDILNFAASTSDYFNSLQSIYVQQTISPVGRYHLELGALYDDVTVSPSEPALTKLSENLKVRYLKQNISSPIFEDSNKYVSISRFSMSVPEIGGTYEGNGIFEFVAPKFNIDDDLYQGDLTVRIGSREGVSEFSSGNITTDGIEMNISGSLVANIGFALDFEGEGDDYLMINVNDLRSLYVNTGIRQDNGDIEQRARGEVSIRSQVGPNIGADWFQESNLRNQGIAISGNKLIAVGGDPSPSNTESLGRYMLFDLIDPAEPHLITRVRTDARISNYVITLGGGSQQPTTTMLGSGLADVDIAGEFAYFVNNMDAETSISTGGLTDPEWDKAYFQIGRIFEDGQNIERVSYIAPSELEGAHMVKVRGQHAFVVTNKNHSNGTEGYGLTTKGRLVSVNIADPITPYVEDDFSYTFSEKDKFVDLDIHEKYAATIRVTSVAGGGGFFRIDLCVFDISDPTDIQEQVSTNNGGTPIFSGSSADTLVEPNFAAVKMKGTHAYCVWKNKLYVYDIAIPKSNGIPTLLATIDIADISVDVSAEDIEVAGNRAYILVKDPSANASKPSTTVKVDISDPENPELISSAQLAESANGTRFKYSGKYLYAVSAEDPSLPAVIGRGVVSVIDNDGLVSPGAHIHNIRASHLDVDLEAHIQRLNVSESINVGPGGIYIDSGEGLTADGTIRAILNSETVLPKGIVASITNNEGEFDTSVALSELIVSGGSPVFNSTFFGNKVSVLNSEFLGGPKYGNFVNFTNNDLGGAPTYLNYLAYGFGSNTGSSTKYGFYVLNEEENYLSGNLEVGENIDIGGNADIGGDLEVTGTGEINGIFTTNDNLIANDKIFLPNQPLTANINRKAAVRGTGGEIQWTLDDLYIIIANLISDRNAKENIESISSLDKVLELSPVSYKYKDKEQYGENRKYGFIAQDVNEIFPEIVTSSNNGSLLIDKFSFTALNTSAIQELHEIVKEKDNKIKELESRLELIEKKIGL